MARDARPETLTFHYIGHSANLDTFACSDSDWRAEIIANSLRSVTQPDGSRKLVRVSPATFGISVKRRGAKVWEDVVRFTYAPTRNPKGMHVPDRTATRLIRAHLKEKAGK